MKLSLIICVHNTSPDLLIECLSSIGNSTLKYADYEIILVDDGSDIDYSPVVMAYGIRYERQPRQGTLAARILGVRAARGEYIAFVDSDDTVSFNYHLPMVRRAECGFDIVFNHWAFRSKSTRYYCFGDTTMMHADFADKPICEYLKNAGKEHSYYVLWNKVYGAALIKRVAEELSRLDIPHPFCYSEDALINLYAFLFAEKISTVATGYYYYRIHPLQSVNAASKESLLRQIRSMGFTLRAAHAALSGVENESVLQERISEWQALMARAHYAAARQLGCPELYPSIRKEYGVKRLLPPTRADGAVYEKVRLIPENAEQIDKAILTLCERDGKVSVRRPGSPGYTALALSGISSLGIPVEYGKAYPALPREVVPIRKKILFNPTVHTLGARIFKKGSKVRAFLKRFI